MSAPRVLYFGCWDRVGHYLHDTTGDRPRDPIGGLDGGKLDAPFVPDRARSGPEGVARLTHLDGNTILAFRDNSIDSRGGSHSTFVITGERDYAEALALARESFPFVFARLEKRGISVVPEAGSVTGREQPLKDRP